MDIIIHGTKLGRKILSTRQLPGLLDITSDSPKPHAIGQFTYAIRIVNNHLIYSKYIVVRDVLGEKRIGFLGFTIFCSPDENLKGEDIVNALDKTASIYCERYVKDGNFISDRENWDFLEEIINETIKKIKVVQIQNLNHYSSGSIDDAIVYYSDIATLYKFLEDPYFEEYRPYRQILFIYSNLKESKENPINAIRNSGIELLIDIDNKCYSLINYNRNRGVIFKVNGRLLDGHSNHYTVKEKDEISFYYCSDEDCFYPINLKGSLYDKTSEIHSYLKINGSNISIDYEAFIPVEKPKVVYFNIEYSDERNFENCNLRAINSRYSLIKGNINKLEFKGAEIKERWLVSAEDVTGEWVSNELNIIPIQIHEPQKLVLNRKKVIEIVIQKNELTINEYRIWLNDGRGNRKNINKLIFEGDEIDRQYNIEVESSSDKNKFVGKVEKFCPATGPNRLIINLKEEKKAFYGEKPQIEKGDSGNDGEEKKPRNSRKKFAIVGISLVLIGAITWYLLYNDNTESDNNVTAQTIQKYVNDIELKSDTLNDYRKKWDELKPNSENIFSGLLRMFNIRSSGKEVTQWEQTRDKLDSAIELREQINGKRFAELKNWPFSNNQRKFYSTIKSIDTSHYKKIREKLVDISNLNLIEISDSIKFILKSTTSVDNNKSGDKSNSEQIKIKKPLDDTGNINQAKKSENESVNELGNQSKPENSTNQTVYNSDLKAKYDDLVSSGNADKREKYIKLLNDYKNASGVDPNIINYLILITNKNIFDDFVRMPVRDKQRMKQPEFVETNN